MNKIKNIVVTFIYFFLILSMIITGSTFFQVFISAFHKSEFEFIFYTFFATLSCFGLGFGLMYALILVFREKK
jgi:hypothetical protein